MKSIIYLFSFSVLIRSKEEKVDWIDTLLRAMEELYERKSSLKTGREGDTELGRRAPNYIKHDSITKCMDCGTNFGVIRRKHHCHACGVVNYILECVFIS